MRLEDEQFLPEGLLGKTVGQYQLIGLLGIGDTSVVYKAFQPAMSRYVAVKVLFPSLATSPEFIEQFQRRLSRMAPLQHNNIIPVYDYGQEDDLLYAVTRYVDEGTLEDYFPDYYSTRTALRIIQPVAEALDYAHAQGLVHTNLKPENILIEEEQRPLLTDFGALRQEPPIPRRPSTYTSPEQIRGEPLDHRSDVYGLGALLFTLLVGQPPSPGQAPMARAHRPDLAPAVEKTILKAMAPTPQERFQSAGELSHAFQLALQKEASAATRPAAKASAPELVYIPTPERHQEGRSLTGLISIFGVLALLATVAVIHSIFFTRNNVAAAPAAAQGVPVLTATSDVDVRAGPGASYEVVGIIRAGQRAEAIGISPDHAWWVIKFPALPGGSGWVHDSFINQLDSPNLPVVQPPPIPAGEP